MSRRSTVEKVLVATANVTSGTSPLELVAATADGVLAPTQVCIAGGAAVATVTLTHGSGPAILFMTIKTPVNGTVCVPFPDGLELATGDEIDINTDQDVDVTLYYHKYDEGPGVTKVQSRANTFSNVTATRTPSNVIGHDKS